MSSVVWDGDNLIQKVGGNLEELGHVKYDESSNQHVLWLKDIRDVFGTHKGYVRGDSFPSMKDAKQHAAFSTSASLFHYMWMVGLRGNGNETDKDVAQSIEDAERGMPLTVSTFMEEMSKAKKEASEKERNSKKREILFFVIGLALGLIGIVASLV